MKVSVMPVLHARTFNVDFRTGKLLVEPEIFTDKDSQQVYDIAIESTRQLEMAPECGRYIILGTGEYTVVGRTVRFIDLYKSCDRTPQYCNVDKEDGRPAYGFVGIMIPSGTVVTPFLMSDALILNVYEHCIKDRWNEKIDAQCAFNTKKMGFFDVDIEKMPEQPDYAPLLVNATSQTILEDSEELREQILFNAMKRALNGGRLSLCTSVTSIESSIFSVITCKNATFKAKEVARAIEKIGDRQKEKKSIQGNIGAQSKRNANGLPLIKSTRDSTLPVSNRRSEKSLDDILDMTTTPDEGEDSFQPRLPKKNTNNFTEKALILGTVLGITFIVVELACHAGPLLLAVTGAYTIIVGGIEAKRIIDRFK